MATAINKAKAKAMGIPIIRMTTVRLITTLMITAMGTMIKGK